jgi:hypothetical protein
VQESKSKSSEPGKAEGVDSKKDDGSKATSKGAVTTTTAAPNNSSVVLTNSQTQGSSNSTAQTKVSLNPAKKRRKFDEISPPKGRKYESEDQIRISELLERIASSDKERSLVRICGESMPYVVNGVIVKKREELIPLLMTIIAQHPEPSVRSDLIKMMLNLIKKPNEYEREIIMTSIVYLASIIGPERTETEILFALSEEYNSPPSKVTSPNINNPKNVKHEEKRIMIAKLCGR